RLPRARGAARDGQGDAGGEGADRGDRALRGHRWRGGRRRPTRRAPPLHEGDAGEGELLHLRGRHGARRHEPRGGELALPRDLQGAGRPQLRRVRDAEPDPRARARDRQDRRHPGAGRAEDDLQRGADLGRDVGELDLGDRRDGRGPALGVAGGARLGGRPLPRRGGPGAHGGERALAAVAHPAHRGGEGDRQAPRGRAGRHRVRGAHRARGRPRARRRPPDERVEHRREHPDEHGDPRHHDRRRRRGVGGALVERVVRRRGARLAGAAVGGANRGGACRGEI
ncbi:MAG: peptidase M20, partial [uncultured Gemmatimonadaceae bacterium]